MESAKRDGKPWHPSGRDRIVLYILALAVLVGAGYRYVASQRASGGAVRTLRQGERVEYRVDINTATAAELDLLPGIGPAKARRIIGHREAHGPFRTLAEVARVASLGADGMAKLRGLVVATDAAPAGGDSMSEAGGHGGQPLRNAAPGGESPR